MHAPIPAPGEVVWIRQQRWRVEHAHVEHAVVRLDVRDRDRRLTFLSPFDHVARVISRRRLRHARPAHATARLAGLLAHAYRQRTVSSALEANVAILPHQLEPALAVLDGTRRLLIADQVGLGKTIQAGLVLAELRRRLPSLRALILIPAGLRDQWRQELEERFALPVLVAERQAWTSHVRDSKFGANPWQQDGIWLASLDYLKQPHVVDGMPATLWDVVIVDEAHEACGDSERYRACDAIARLSRHVLLLTATPHSGDDARFSRLARLGSLRTNPDPLVMFRRTRAALGWPSARRVRWNHVGLSSAEQGLFAALADFEQSLLAVGSGEARCPARLLASVFNKRALSTMSALAISLKRRLEWLESEQAGSVANEWLQARLDFGDADDDADDEERQALTARIGMGQGHERVWLRRLQTLVRVAQRDESKLTRLCGLIAGAQEPVVVFTEFRHSLTAVSRRLSVRRPVSVLHGGLSTAERTQSLRRFLRGETTVLIATDVAAQGVNLQTRARWVINLDVPWNPVRLEQRLGRVDRIGQTRPVHCTVLVARHESESKLLSHLAQRMAAARHALGNGIFADGWNRAQSQPPNEPVGLANGCLSLARWRPRAKVVAAQLEHRRALARRWRAPTHFSRRPTRTPLRALPMIRRLGSGTLVVVSVPLVTAQGTVLERHVVCFDLRQIAADAVETMDFAAHARLALQEIMKARLRRLSARERARVGRMIEIEETLTAHLQSSVAVSDQPHLFDPRPSDAYEATKDLRAALAAALQRRVHAYHAEATLDLGDPVIEIVFDASR